MPSGRVFAGSKVDVGSVSGIVTITGTVAGPGAGVQYVMGTTAGDNTKTGTVFIGVNATTARVIALGATGGVSYVDTINFIAAGTVNAIATGTVTALPSGSQDVIIVNTPTVTASQGGTWNVSTVSTLLGTVTIAGTVTDIPSGTQTIAGSVSLSGTGNVTVAGTPTIAGSVSVINAPTVTIGGTASAFLLGGTVEIGGVRIVAHQSKTFGYLSQTTAVNAVVITSGAHTLYIQDIIISVETAMNIKFFSAATTKLGPLYFATQGGTRIQFIQPMVLNSNQSLTVTPSASGTCSVYAGGYTVT